MRYSLQSVGLAILCCCLMASGVGIYVRAQRRINEGLLAFEVEPAGTIVYVDNKEIGTAPLKVRPADLLSSTDDPNRVFSVNDENNLVHLSDVTGRVFAISFRAPDGHVSSYHEVNSRTVFKNVMLGQNEEIHFTTLHVRLKPKADP